MNVIERYFGIDGRNTTIKTEILAGLTTFLTMAYIIFVNPDMLAKAGTVSYTHLTLPTKA